jgi:hypothetical protein
LTLLSDERASLTGPMGSRAEIWCEYRALDILVTLVESAGETIGKDLLIARTWPDTVVDEGALRVHVAALRKALGDGGAGKRYIVNSPGRGYSFAAPVAREQRQPAIAPTNGTAVRGNLPALLTRIVGRDDIIAALAAQLAQRRFLTIVGPGGIGKTKAAARVPILATSREPLRAEGEWMRRLTSLELPPRSDNLTPEGALQYSAVQLFNERALPIIDGFALGDEDVAPVLEICRRLDGMPLAIELAAARVDVFGVKGLAARLDDRFADFDFFSLPRTRVRLKKSPSNRTGRHHG